MSNIICRILVIDDNADVRKTIAGILRDRGYDVKAAGSEAAAKRILAKETFHFIVLDIRLHGHDDDDASGLKLAKSIRALGIRSKIIFVTGKPIETSHIDSVIEYGVIAYIKKTGNWIETIQKTIEKHFLRFDVFLCHNSQDKPAIKQIGNELITRGLRPWLDEWELQPGLPWQTALEQQIGDIDAAAVFVGKNGIGPWQEAELNAFLREFIARKCPVIPVLLSNAPKKPVLPVFLRGMLWVDFRKDDPDPLRQLIWGITGNKY